MEDTRGAGSDGADRPVTTHHITRHRPEFTRATLLPSDSFDSSVAEVASQSATRDNGSDASRRREKVAARLKRKLADTRNG
jgi:hypothetical protein